MTEKLLDSPRCPNNCGREGPHFAPPSMGEPGFFTCNNNPDLGPAANPITTADPPLLDSIPPDVQDRAAVLMTRLKNSGKEQERALVLNGKLQAIDAVVKTADEEPSIQMALLMIATVLATGRLLAKLDIKDRGRRSKIIKATVKEFEGRLRRYVATVKPGASVTDNV